jgi:uncharacterized SAM-binding protein YcdF (DUF218 family)
MRCAQILAREMPSPARRSESFSIILFELARIRVVLGTPAEEETGTRMHIQTIREGLWRWRRPTFWLLGLLVLWLVASSGGFLVVDKPQKADVILVLGGETDRRPARGLELFDLGYGARLVLDAPEATIYRWPLPELAQKYAQSLPEANAITVCAIYGLSTKAEAQEASRCLEKVGGKNVLLLTSDYHTRRAVAIFRQEIPQLNFSVATAHDPREFGVNGGSIASGRRRISMNG